MDDCLFCKIAAGVIQYKQAYSDELCCAFYDIAPQAPVHILIVPRTHIGSAGDICAENSAVVAHIFEVAARLARELGLDSGWRVVTNVGPDAGQSVHHLHFHLIGGKKLSLEMA